MIVERADPNPHRRLSHQALFYRDAESFLVGTVPFILDGLADGEPVVVVVPGRQLRLLEEALGPTADDVSLLDINAMGRNPGRLIPAVLTTFADKPDEPIRVIGEPIWPGRSDDEYPACVQHEALVNVAFADREATLLCPYDVSALSEVAAADAEATHDEVVESTGVRRSERFAPYAAYEQYNLRLPTPDDALLTPFDLATLAKARRVATDFAARAGISGTRLSDVSLAVGEVCANSIEHGGGAGVLAVWSQGDGVVCQVKDAGCPQDRLVGRIPPTKYQWGGRGLILVHQLADLVRTHVGPDGMTTRIHLRPE